MKKILLDTNAYVGFKQGNQNVISILQSADEIGISVVVIGELLSGFSVGTKYKENLNELHEFLNNSRVITIAIDETTPSFYAQIYANLRQKGKPIPTNDLWIAASALQKGYKLCSFDRHFKAIENLIIANTVEEFY